MLNWLPKELTFHKSQLAAHGFFLLSIGANAAQRNGSERNAARARLIARLKGLDYPPTESWNLSSARARLDQLTLLTGKCRNVSRHAMRSPDRCAKLCYRLLLLLARNESYDLQLVSDLMSAFALGFLGLQLCKPCEICFRTALPFEARCQQHSRSSSKPYGGQTDSDISQNARTARRTLRQLNLKPWVREQVPSEVPQLLQASAQTPVRMTQWPVERVENVLLGLLWGIIPFQQEWLVQVQAELERAEAVSSLVGPRASDDPAAVARQLRAAIDPLEFDAWELVREIPEVQGWLAAERKVTPGKRKGPSPKTIQLQRDIEALTEQGLKQRAVATKLKIDESYISKLKRRHPKLTEN